MNVGITWGTGAPEAAAPVEQATTQDNAAVPPAAPEPIETSMWGWIWRRSDASGSNVCSCLCKTICSITWFTCSTACFTAATYGAVLGYTAMSKQGDLNTWDYMFPILYAAGAAMGCCCNHLRGIAQVLFDKTHAHIRTNSIAEGQEEQNDIEAPASTETSADNFILSDSGMSTALEQL